MRFKTTTPPAAEPVSLDEAKAHIRSTADDEDELVTGWIKETRETVEEYTRRALITQTITLKLDGWPRGCHGGFRHAIVLPRPPLIAVDSVHYIDANGTSQELGTDGYQVVDSGDFGILVPAYGRTWPTLRAQPDSVTIIYTAGYGGAEAVPQRAKQAMLLLIGHRDQHRANVITGTITAQLPMTVESLLASLSCGSYA